MEVTPAVVSNINRTISHGTNKGVFVLPKGMVGSYRSSSCRSMNQFL